MRKPPETDRASRMQNMVQIRAGNVCFTTLHIFEFFWNHERICSDFLPVRRSLQKYNDQINFGRKIHGINASHSQTLCLYYSRLPLISLTLESVNAQNWTSFQKKLESLDIYIGHIFVS